MAKISKSDQSKPGIEGEGNNSTWPYGQSKKAKRFLAATSPVFQLGGPVGSGGRGKRVRKVRVTDFPLGDLSTGWCYGYSEETKLFPAPSWVVFQRKVTVGVGDQVEDRER